MCCPHHMLSGRFRQAGWVSGLVLGWRRWCAEVFREFFRSFSAGFPCHSRLSLPGMRRLFRFFRFFRCMGRYICRCTFFLFVLNIVIKQVIKLYDLLPTCTDNNTLLYLCRMRILDYRSNNGTCSGKTGKTGITSSSQAGRGANGMENQRKNCGKTPEKLPSAHSIADGGYLFHPRRERLM